MRHPQRSFVESHVQSVAALWLTRNRKLRVLDYDRDLFGIDLVVAVENGGLFSGRQFGAAVVKASRSSESAPRLTARELGRERERFADQMTPVCMLAFPTSGDAGWFRWILEPAGCEGCTELAFSDCIGFVAATDELLARVVDRVNRWYDARRSAA